MMHAIKGGWVGQTFALAKCNDSAGKKSRIRRSKEERKELVESFIKKYQSSNNGNFPSLNLTHKECGGSFYTIREIVREVIQENRVLGPAKLLPGDQNADQLLDQYPLGTISTKPKASFAVSPNGSSFSHDEHLTITEEPDIIFAGISAEPEQQVVDNGQMINGCHVIAKIDESDEPKVAEVQVIEPLETVVQVSEPLETVVQVSEPLETVVQVSELLETMVQVSEPLETEKTTVEIVASEAKVIQMADVVVETFPLRPVGNSTDYLDANFVVRDSRRTLEEKDTIEMYSEPRNNNSVQDGVHLVDHKEVKVPEDQLLERNSSSAEEKEVKDLAEPPLEGSNSFHDAVDVEEKSLHKAKAIAETQVVDVLNGIQTKNANGTYANTVSGVLIDQEEIMTGNKVEDIQNSASSQKGSNATLDRINLKSWERASNNRAESESNPLLAILKSFVTAFVKFWSE